MENIQSQLYSPMNDITKHTNREILNQITESVCATINHEIIQPVSFFIKWSLHNNVYDKVWVIIVYKGY